MKLLIFDFDGTVVDSKKAYYSSMIKELKVFGYKEKDINKVIDMGLSLRKTLGHLGLNFLVRLYLHYRIMSHVKNYLNKIKKCHDVSSINKINERKILVTNSVDDFAEKIMKHLKISKYFSEVYGADDFSDKAEFIKKYLKENKISPKECYYIGDRAVDSKVARECKCQSIIISNSCSWDSKKDIIKSSPDFLISDLKDIKEIVSK